VALAFAEGLVGLYGAYWLDLPPGPPVAVLGSLTYAVIALGTGLRPARAAKAAA
jgi:ABC-type Mn2+/Zn2+ transport system permease subunit